MSKILLEFSSKMASSQIRKVSEQQTIINKSFAQFRRILWDTAIFDALNIFVPTGMLNCPILLNFSVLGPSTAILKTASIDCRFKLRQKSPNLHNSLKVSQEEL